MSQTKQTTETWDSEKPVSLNQFLLKLMIDGYFIHQTIITSWRKGIQDNRASAAIIIVSKS